MFKRVELHIHLQCVIANAVTHNHHTPYAVQPLLLREQKAMLVKVHDPGYHCNQKLPMLSLYYGTFICDKLHDLMYVCICR